MRAYIPVTAGYGLAAIVAAVLAGTLWPTLLAGAIIERIAR
jgi:hypothetical protein